MQEFDEESVCKYCHCTESKTLDYSSVISFLEMYSKNVLLLSGLSALVLCQDFGVEVGTKMKHTYTTMYNVHSMWIRSKDY